MMMESSIKTWSHKTGSQCSEKYRMIDQSSQMFYVQVHPAVTLKNITTQFYLVFLTEAQFLDPQGPLGTPSFVRLFVPLM